MDNREIAFAAAMAGDEGGGSGGTTDYNDLSDKPQINGNQLIGDKSTRQLGIKEPWVGTAAQYAQEAATIPAGTPIIITDDQDMDTVPTAGSSNPVTSNGVFSSLARLDASTGDIYFGQTRVARLMDYDSYAALSTKENIYYLTYPTPSQNSGRSLQAAPVVENENTEREGIRTEPEEPAPDESEMR